MVGEVSSKVTDNSSCSAPVVEVTHPPFKDSPLQAEVVLLRYALALASLHDFPDVFECSFGKTTTPAFMSSKCGISQSSHLYISLFYKDRGTIQLFQDTEHQTYTALIHDSNKSLSVEEYQDWQCEDIVATIINRDILGMQKNSSSEKLIMLGSLILK